MLKFQHPAGGPTKEEIKINSHCSSFRSQPALSNPTASLFVWQHIGAMLSSPALPYSQVAPSQDWQTAGREICHHLEHDMLPETATANKTIQFLTSVFVCV